jgi:hypothetical protein
MEQTRYEKLSTQIKDRTYLLSKARAKKKIVNTNLQKKEHRKARKKMSQWRTLLDMGWHAAKRPHPYRYPELLVNAIIKRDANSLDLFIKSQMTVRPVMIEFETAMQGKCC